MPATTKHPASPESSDAAAGVKSEVTAAGLRFVSDCELGIRRKPVAGGGGFRYFSPKVDEITDEQILTRIKLLAIPPAYKSV